ncbi:MAG TPA: twin-arginine translocase subunit TatC, partial [Verrucomicrobiae bacterium]
KWPLTRAKISYPGTNQIAVVSFGTNHIGNFQLTADQQKAFNLGTNRFVSVQIEPLIVGTNQILGWRVNTNGANAIADAQRLHIDLINLSPAGGFFVAFQVALYGGTVLASPFIFYFVVAFIFPALKMREQKYVYRGLFFGGGLFLLGISFCYFILMPVALAASQMYSNWLGFGALQWRAEDYIGFVCRFMLGMGLGFELPVVVLTLVKIGILNYSMLSKARRYMIVINLILGAVLTTPEVLTQLVMFVPLQLLYEITVWIAWYWERQGKKRAARES